MNDRNAAIKALERAWNYLDVQSRTFKAVVLKCNGVYDGVTVFDETLDGIKDAIALLKAQEPIKAVVSEEKYGDALEHCPSCERALPNSGIYGKSCYCYKCGQAVKWE